MMLPDSRRAHPVLPWRMVWMVTALIGLPGVIAVTAILLATAPSGGQASPSPAASRHAVASPACASDDRSPVKSSRPGAESDVVPPGATSVLLCRYGPGASPMVRKRLIRSSSLVSMLVSELNALPAATGAYSCPNDDGEAIVADFLFASGVPDPVNIGLEGCRLVGNGHVSRIGDGHPVIGRLADLVPWLGSIRGLVKLCGGHGRCRTESFVRCGRTRCYRASGVAIMNREGAAYAPAIVRRGLFRARVEPGRYKLALLGTSGSGAQRVLATTRVRVRLDRVSRVTFLVNGK